METPAQDQGLKSQPRSNRKSQSQRRSSVSKDKRSRSSSKSQRTKNNTDNHTVSLAKDMIVRSKVDVRKPRGSKLKAIDAFNKAMAEKAEKSKMRKKR